MPATAVLKGTGASLCEGSEALLLFRITPPNDPQPRLVVQARCKSSFPPDPMRAGLNGEFELPVAVRQANWNVEHGVVSAHYTSGDELCTTTWIADRQYSATYGIGLTETNCKPSQ